MWKVGDLSIDGRVVLGPMSGYTSEAYRLFMKPFGTALSYTEMVSDSAMMHNPRSDEYLMYGSCPFTGTQVFGSDPERMAIAAEECLRRNPNTDLFDVNMGCPVEKVVRRGAGSVLMTDPARCGEIVRRIKRQTGIPVTAKIRLGQGADSMNFREVITELEAAEVDAITVHARTREERYAGIPHYDLIRDLRKEMSVPLVVSGNVFSLDDAIGYTEITGADAVMVARGGIGNPFLVTQIDRWFRDGTRLPNPTISQQVDWCLELADMLIAEKGEEMAAKKLRSIAPKFIVGCRHSREFRYRLATEIDDRASLEAILEEVRERLGDRVVRTLGYRTSVPEDD